MTDTKLWKEVRALFEQCLEATGQARGELLCAARPAVRDEVEALLAVDEQAGGQLDPDRASEQFADATGLSVATGQQIGGYRVERLIGKGGMGSVYLARQQNPDRDVAIKLQVAEEFTGGGQDRFAREIALLAKLQHPGIAQIFDAGTHRQQTAFGEMQWPFFVMEYVEGARSISEWADQLPAREVDAVLPTARLLCEAVAYAHQQGVVHRDIKPHNVLVDEGGRVKLIDFGIARWDAAGAAASASLTGTGDVIGTLQYMAPEQISGGAQPITAAADVYALGAVLFELLSGRPAFDIRGKSLTEAGRIVSETEAPALSLATAAVDQDLALIVAKALRKEPEQRYATASELVEDLRRFEAGLPILARPLSTRYQLRMLMRRRSKAVFLATAAVAAVLVTTLVSGYFADEARSARSAAEREAATRQDAEQRVLDVTVQGVIGLINELEALPNTTAARRAAADSAREQLGYLESRGAPDADQHIALARAHTAVGSVQGYSGRGHLGEYAEAIASFDRAIAHFEAAQSLRALVPDELVLFARAEHHRAAVMNDLGDLDGIAASVAQASGLLAQLPQELTGATRAEALRLRASLELLQSWCASRQMDPEKALGHLRAALGFYRSGPAKVGDVDVDDVDTVRSLGLVLYNLGRIELARGEQELGVAHMRDAIKTMAAADDRPHWALVRSYLATARSFLGYELCKMGEVAEGEALLRRARESLVTLLDQDPQNVRLKGRAGGACERLADHLAISARRLEGTADARARYVEAAEVAAQGLAIADSMQEPDMMSKFVAGECRRIQALCQEALR